VTQVASRSSLTTLYCIPQASLVVVACGMSIFTLGFFEPTLLPYLTEYPFKMTTGQVGLLMTGTSIMMGITAAVAGPAQYVCGQLVQMVFGMIMVASAMALFAFKSPDAYPQFTVVAYVMACGGVMILFVAATELLVRVLRTFDINPNEHAEALSAGVSLSFTAGLVGGSLFGGLMVEQLTFRGATKVLFFIMAALPFVTVIPFHPVFMQGKTLAKSSPAPSKNKKGKGKETDEEEG